MRRALGLGNSAPARAQVAHSMAPSNAHAHRRFVRDGEVPVTVVHHDDSGGTNKLEAARQALREQIETREQIQRQLEEAQTAIQALQTELAHERIAREETVRHAEARKAEIEQALRVTRQELVAEHQARHQAEEQRDKAIARREEAEERLREIMAAQKPQEASRGSASVKRAMKAAKPKVNDAAPAKDAAARRRRGRPPKVRETESEFVEWWKPGWRDRFR